MIGDNVKRLRESLGYSQNAFAKQCNLPRATLYNIENHKVNGPCYAQLCKICKGAGITPNELIPKEDYTR